MSGKSIDRREMLKIGAVASAATFLNFGANSSSASAQNQTANVASAIKIIRLWGNENPYGLSLCESFETISYDLA